MRFFEGAINFLPNLKPYWLFENGTGESKGMKFAFFTARVNISGSKSASMFFPTKLFVPVGVVRAADDRGKFPVDELLDQLIRCNLPNGKDSPQTDQGGFACAKA